ncbi:SGNH/GDSL hydrolase family protein [Rhodococcus rhodochrous]|uniref:SGNH/GDSL hydrolase family protein n=1 Tax=Rhodococcus rhodochrous TaxID=1829 RepID=UPI001E57DF88|nr:SGNH/GDSL hydrolase family protein [Rhodococcus rhodochrous]MCB8910104.1 SGNH/GDSL hydrolase family protein [Rhodococcus rhodochrous]
MRKIKKKNKWTVLGSTSLAFALILVGYGVFTTQFQFGSSRDAKVEYSPPQVPSFRFQLDEVGPKMLKSDKYSIVVLGDSTGNQPWEWVHVFAQKLGDSGRRVKLLDWSTETSSYSTETMFGPKDAENEIEIWNGSVSGAPAVYSLENWNNMVPSTPDLYIINHGHNELDAFHAVDSIKKLVAKARPAGVAIIKQNPRTDDAAQRQETIVESIEQSFANASAGLIDVYSAFQAEPNISILLEENGFLPNSTGHQIWAESVWNSIGLAHNMPE